MTREERQYHAQELIRNPLFAELCDKLEQDAVNRCVAAKYDDHQARVMAASDIRALRTFRQNCEAAARNNPAQKTAPA